MPVEVPLTRGFVALVDEFDVGRITQYRWYAQPQPDGRVYACRTGRVGEPHTIRMHRFILEAFPRDIIDHKDCNGLNNCRSNIRIATATQNAFNRHPDRTWRHNKHGYRGVAYLSNNRNYRGRIAVNGIQHYTKAFATPIEAAIAWDALALKHYGEFATLNFPDLRSAA